MELMIIRVQSWNFTVKSVSTMCNLEIGAITLFLKTAKFAVEHNFCDIEIGTCDRQQITSYRHDK